MAPKGHCVETFRLAIAISFHCSYPLFSLCVLPVQSDRF